MNNLIDRYTFGARVAPAVVVATAAMLAFAAWFPLDEWKIKFAGGGMVLAIAFFVLSQMVRDAGKVIEGPLWDTWGGPPTMRMLRHRDATYESGIKALTHRRLVALGVVLAMPTEAEETADPAAADVVYRTCSDWLRNTALQKKAKAPFDVVHTENIAYGFRRNLLGIKPVGLLLCGGALMATGAAFFFGKQPFFELSGIVVLGAYLLFGVTKQALKRAADEYSKRLLNAVQTIPLPDKKNKIEKGHTAPMPAKNSKVEKEQTTRKKEKKSKQSAEPEN